MKQILLSILMSMFLFGQAQASEIVEDTLANDLWQCKIQRVLLVDDEECEFLGKIIGTPFHCLNITDKGLLFWNLGREDLAVLIDPKDHHYRWFKDQN